MGTSSRLERIAAGVVTPTLSMLFYELASALQQHKSLGLSPRILPWTLLLAAVLGAPWAVPVALATRVMRIWSAVPFIAIVGALGIELQMELSRLVPDTSPLSFYLMLIWVVPAALGTAAALLLKWRRVPSVIAFTAVGLILSVVVTAQGVSHARTLDPIHAAAQSWSKLRVGMRVYTAEESNRSGRLICPTMAALLAAQHSDTAGQCHSVAAALPAIVDEIIPCKKTDPDWGYESPHVRLHASDGSWSGFADAASLQPDVPVGSVIDMERDWGTPLGLRDERGSETNIGGSATVKVLRYDPKREASLYVRILDGRYTGRVGWMGIQNAQTSGVALGEYDMEYPYQACSDFSQV